MRAGARRFIHQIHNTAIPSSAAVERLFSIGKDILTAKRAKLSDANFERLMFMKGNQHHVAGMQAKQAASGRNIVTTSTLILLAVEIYCTQ